ncbi:MAG: lysophospholipid acyltransferase family protein [Bacteroidota bacterium]
MRTLGKFIAAVARLGLEAMCRIDKSDLHKVPARGPLIAYSNHTGSVEVPILFTELLPRPLTGLAKIESWNGWFLRWVFNAWDAIPLRRGEADMAAMNKALEALQGGYILGMSPEGTRNKTGRLIRGQPGIVTLALHSHAPLLPLANWGGENFLPNLRRLKRTDFYMRVGQPFTLDTHGERVTREVRQRIVDEMMFRVAALLPEKYRGVYADSDRATDYYLKDTT